MAENEERDMIEDSEEIVIEDSDSSQNTRERITVEGGKRSLNLLEKVRGGREVWAIVLGVFILLIVYLTYSEIEGLFIRGNSSFSAPVTSPRGETTTVSILLLLGYFLLVLGCSAFLLKRIGILLLPLSRYVWNRSFVTLSIAFSNIDRNVLVRRTGIVLLILMTFIAILIPIPVNRFLQVREQGLYRSGGDIAITVMEDDPLFTNDTTTNNTTNGLQIRDLSEGLLNETSLQSIAELSHIKSIGGFTQTNLHIGRATGSGFQNFEATIIIFTPISTNYTYSYWKKSYGDIGSLFPTGQNSVNIYSPAERSLDFNEYRYKKGENLSLGLIIAPNEDHGVDVEYKIEDSFSYLPGALYLSEESSRFSFKTRRLNFGQDDTTYSLLIEKPEFNEIYDVPIIMSASMETRDLIVERVLNLTEYKLDEGSFSIRYLLEVEDPKENWKPALNEVETFLGDLIEQDVFNGLAMTLTPWIDIDETEAWITRTNLVLWILVGFHGIALVILQALYLFNFYKDRRNEIGTYKSSGIRNRQILKIILMESFILQIIALIGACAGFYLSRAAYAVFSSGSSYIALPFTYDFPMILFLTILLVYYLIIIISNYMVLRSIGRKKIAELLG